VRDAAEGGAGYTLVVWPSPRPAESVSC